MASGNGGHWLFKRQRTAAGLMWLYVRVFSIIGQKVLQTSDIMVLTWCLFVLILWIRQESKVSADITFKPSLGVLFQDEYKTFRIQAGVGNII